MQSHKRILLQSSDLEHVPSLVNHMLYDLRGRAAIQNETFWNREVPKTLRFKGRIRSLPKLFRDSLIDNWLAYRDKILWMDERIYLVMGWAYGQESKGFELIFNGYIKRWKSDWYDRKYLLFVQVPPPSSMFPDYFVFSRDLNVHEEDPFVLATGSLLPMAGDFSYARHKDSWLLRKT